VGALTFGSTLNRLVTTPARYGWNWDAMIDTYDSGASPGLIKKVTADRDLSGVTVGSRGNVTIAGQALSAFGFDARRGEVLPVATSGRFPKAPGEVALGAKTLRDLNRSVSDSISARTAGGKETHLRIVGRTLLPSLSLNGTFGLGEGVALTTAGLRRLDPGADPSFFVVDLKPGVRRATINRRYGALGPQRPGDIQAYERVRATPLILAGLLAFLGVGVLAHMLVTSIRSRRRDLAILKTIGFSRRQVAVAVAWQATTLAGIALALAIPIGLVFGRWTWRAFADDLGVAADVAFPILILGAVSVTALLLANLIAALPAHAGARTRPAVVLRSE
jgi:putative ABC transport system permease protein